MGVVGVKGNEGIKSGNNIPDFLQYDSRCGTEQSTAVDSRVLVWGLSND